MKIFVFLSFLFITTIVSAQNAENQLPDHSNSAVYEMVEQEASFPGSYDHFLEYIQNNLHYPEKALKDSIQGTVIITCVVNEDGSLSDFKIQKGIPELNEEALQVLKNSPKWIPGKMNGKSVKSMVRVPIVFKLQ